jgi:hypothetical protein
LRRRPFLAIAIVVTVALGLASRKVPVLFPALLGKYPGDALWSLMVYWTVAWLIPDASIKKVALLALAFSYADEVSQLYQAPWINAVRRTTLGHLVLGSAFSWLDMLAYTIGVAAGATVEYFLPFNSVRSGPRHSSVPLNRERVND